MIIDLAVIATISVLAPVAAELLKRIGIPGVILEIGLGIVAGPAVIGLIRPNVTVDVLANMGLCLLMFLAGYELELPRLSGRPMALAGFGWLCSLVLAAAAMAVFVLSGAVHQSLTGTALIGAALTTTALGTLLPVLSDSGVLGLRFGTLMLAIGSVGEFGPIVLVAVLFGGTEPATTVLLLVAFSVLAALAGLSARRAWPSRVTMLLSRSLHTSSQLLIRVGLLVIVGLVYLAGSLGLDVLLGAFAAGIVLRIAVTGHADRASAGLFRAKLEGIGFGLFVPVFFVVSGTRFPITEFVHSPALLLRIPLFLVLLLFVRGLPVLVLYRAQLPWRERLGLALLSATGLPLIVVITAIGTAAGSLSPGDAAALVGAGMLSVILLPILGIRLVRPVGAAPETRPAGPDPDFVEGPELPSAEGL